MLSTFARPPNPISLHIVPFWIKFQPVFIVLQLVTWQNFLGSESQLEGVLPPTFEISRLSGYLGADTTTSPK